jgi:hypothetical protein
MRLTRKRKQCFKGALNWNTQKYHCHFASEWCAPGFHGKQQPTTIAHIGWGKIIIQ